MGSCHYSLAIKVIKGQSTVEAFTRVLSCELVHSYRQMTRLIQACNAKSNLMKNLKMKSIYRNIFNANLFFINRIRNIKIWKNQKN